MQELIIFKSRFLRLSPKEFARFLLSYDRTYIVSITNEGIVIIINNDEDNKYYLFDENMNKAHEERISYYERQLGIINQNIMFIQSESDDKLSKMHKYGKKFITDILFQYFLHKLKTVNTRDKFKDVVSNIKKINEYVHNIIISRQQPISDTEMYTTFDNFPSDIISNVSSFLDFKSLVMFEKCSRSILIAARLPSSMCKMDTKLFKQCATYTLKTNSYYASTFYIWNRFRAIQDIEFEVTDSFLWNDRYMFATETLELSDLPFWKNLISLKLMHTKDEFECEAEEEFKKFAEMLITCNIPNLLTVYLDVYFEGEWVYKIISHIGMTSINCKYMRVSGNEYVDDEDAFDTQYRELILPPSLKAVSLMTLHEMVTHPKTDTVLLPICGGLESFHDKIRNDVVAEWKEDENDSIMDMKYGYIYDDSMINIYDKLSNKLQELCVLWHSKLLIDKIVQMENNFKSLKRLHFNTLKTIITRDNTCDKYRESIILLFRIETLNDIRISADAASSKVIVRLLKTALNNKRIHNLTINITVKDIQRGSFALFQHDVNNDLLEITNTLNQKCNSSKYVLRTVQNDFEQCDSIGQYYQFIIFNQLCGTPYHEWIMTCELCQHDIFK